MKGFEVKAVGPASIFVLFFSACFTIVLIYCLAVNLDLIPRDSLSFLQRLQGRFETMCPVSRSLVWAFVIGLAVGVGGTVLALIYNIFSNMFGGVKLDVKE